MRPSSVLAVCASGTDTAASISKAIASLRGRAQLWPTTLARLSAPVAQRIERRFPKPCVAGSIPAGGANEIGRRTGARIEAHDDLHPELTHFGPLPRTGHSKIRPRKTTPERCSPTRPRRFSVALTSLDIARLDNVFVLIADDVVQYLNRHMDSVRTFDIITNVAPPPPRRFIELLAAHPLYPTIQLAGSV